MKIAVVQMKMSKATGENVAAAARAMEEAAGRGAEVICLPELFTAPYFCQKEDVSFFALAEPIPGPTVEALGAAAERHRIAVIAPLFERRAPGLYHNTAAVLDAAGRLVGIYRKMHIPDDPSYFEKFYFTPGDLGFQAFRLGERTVGVLICWDQWYPEAARLTALRGAEVLFYPTAIGWHPGEKARHGAAQHEAWRTVQRGHAVANGVYVAVANRVGHEVPPDGGPGLEFWGGSFIADPQGVILAEASPDKEDILYAEVDPARLADVRCNWPFFRDRRIDAYGGITRRYLDDAPR